MNEERSAAVSRPGSSAVRMTVMCVLGLTTIKSLGRTEDSQSTIGITIE